MLRKSMEQVRNKQTVVEDTCLPKEEIEGLGREGSGFPEGFREKISSEQIKNTISLKGQVKQDDMKRHNSDDD